MTSAKPRTQIRWILLSTMLLAAPALSGAARADATLVAVDATGGDAVCSLSDTCVAAVSTTGPARCEQTSCVAVSLTGASYSGCYQNSTGDCEVTGCDNGIGLCETLAVS